MHSSQTSESFGLPLAVVAAAWLVSLSSAPAQTVAATTFSAPPATGISTAVRDVTTLPEDPATLLAANQSAQEKAQKFPDPNVPPTRAQVRAERIASLHLKHIPANWRVLPLTRHDKVLLGLKDLYNPYTVGTIVVAAGYSHLTDGRPNFGTDGNAFAERFGAAYARDSSEGIFTDAVFAPLLKEDPRFYVMGPGHGVVHRALYATTRPFVTRSDAGRPVLNGAQLLGYAGASGLTAAYYPPGNRNFSNIAATFGAAMGGSALGDAVDEFAMPLLQKLHLAPR